ncbi:MBL fold metallo-hydrolase [Paenibacillus nicotianae]|uniref:MBL fold metallo-hydrolase n=1 Tax=Paenibacillus nicotianae TaxID=1526551 RepID=A0ABW4UN14_9BACL
MKIADHIEMLELKVPMGGHEMVIHPVVIYADHQAVLLDTGVPGCYDKIIEQIDPAYPVQSVILTHDDLDHIGSFPQFVEAASGTLDVYAQANDADAINGNKPFSKAKPERVNMVLEPFPESIQQSFRSVFSTDTPDHVNHVLQGNEVLPFSEGLQVIHTPGHTPGHTSFYDIASKILIAGDAMIVENGELHGPNPAFTLDMEQAINSLRAFQKLNIEAIVCYHGGLFKGDIQQRLNEIVNHS